MGHYLHLGVAKFVCHDIKFGDDLHQEIFENTDVYTMNMPEFENDENFPFNKFSIYGWKWTDNDHKIKDVSANLWIKENYKVYIVNESQYSNIGRYAMAIGSYDKESLLEFIKDFSITNFTIEENDAIQWWC